METIHWSLDLIVKAKSAARREMNSDQFDKEYDLDRSMRLKIVIEEMLKDIDVCSLTEVGDSEATYDHHYASIAK